LTVRAVRDFVVKIFVEHDTIPTIYMIRKRTMPQSKFIPQLKIYHAIEWCHEFNIFISSKLDQCVISAGKNTTPRSKVYIIAEKYITHSNDSMNKLLHHLQLDHQLLDRHNQYISDKNASNKNFGQKVYEKTLRSKDSTLAFLSLAALRIEKQTYIYWTAIRLIFNSFQISIELINRNKQLSD